MHGINHKLTGRIPVGQTPKLRPSDTICVKNFPLLRNCLCILPHLCMFTHLLHITIFPVLVVGASKCWLMVATAHCTVKMAAMTSHLCHLTCSRKVTDYSGNCSASDMTSWAQCCA